jgi:hypothetical protein
VNSTDDLWINTESYPAGAGISARFVYTTNGSNWVSVPMKMAGRKGANDWWNLNLGKFPPNTAVQYAVSVMESGGREVWDARGGLNFSVMVNAALPVQWIGNSYHWPPNGSIRATDTLWVNTDTWPKNAAVSARVVYSVNGGTWVSKSMNKAGINGNNDWWNYALGVFPAGSTIRYAISTTDANGKTLWDSNGGKDYTMNVP